MIDLLISKILFQRIVKEFMQHVNLKKSMNFDLKIQEVVLNALQETIEKFLMKSFKSKYVLMLESFIALITIMTLLIIHVKCVTIQMKNMKFLNNLRFSMIEKNILNKFIFISFTN